MSRRVPRDVLLLLGVSGVLVGTALVSLGAGSHRPAAAGLSPTAVRDADIAFFELRVANDPIGALDRIRLGGLLLERARANGEEVDLVRAEELARQSLALREPRNAGAWQLLAAALSGQHRFLEALETADRLVAVDSEATGARALRGEILLELGRYPTADSVFAGLGGVRYHPNVAPRYARWLELRGRSGEAHRLLETARDELARRGSPADQLVWYDLRLGELALKYGRHGEARRRLDAGLRVGPADWRLLSVRARLALAEHDTELAITLGDSSLALHVDPATLALVGDAWTARGNQKLAEQYFRAMEALAGSAPRGGFHRAWYLALLDHHRQVAPVLASVTRDLERRQDVYGWDLLAWALHQSGRDREAHAAMQFALAWGNDDPQLLRHARAIARAL